ncbi:hypothetical protein [Lyngbya sp. PCC 8106]|uniref:hypothetical protein n=1 Tax=Lyngbya sp. (strain PCC 8106) TaxID=313612 RepID=UPI0000EAB6F5|nr:hypothetical protein [Lyngbya sp. PCC 8106]EAW34459.1 hypothetical protein L8106_03262 [Lyngbya sp. PCC 8106]
MELAIETEWLVQLKNSALVELINQWVWTYPMIEAVHILGITLLVGSVALFDLRLLGIARHLLVTDLAQYLLPLSYAGFGVGVLSGFLLFATDAPAIALNPFFRLKLILILGTGINAMIFHWKCYPSVLQWNRNIKPPGRVQLIAMVSLLLWVVVIICGNLIAYV